MKRPLSVFHSPIEIAGQMGAMVRGLHRFGQVAVGYNTFHSYLNYQGGTVNTDLGTVQLVYEQTKHLYDIYHYHFGATIYPDMRELRELHAMGRKLVMHHWGNDVRLRSKAQILSPYLYDPCNPLPDDVMIQRTQEVSQWIRTVIIQDFELYDYVKDYYTNIYVLPLAFDVGGVIPSYPNSFKLAPLIIHAPTQPSFKGTMYVEQTLEQLRAEGFQFEYKRIEQMSNTEALSYYQQADLVIDQMLVGTYGTFSVEAMASGKPVVAYIRPDLVSKFPENLPIINADIMTLHDVLVPWITNAQLRYQRGLESRQYAEQVHDIPKVIPRLLDIYDQVMRDT